MNRREDIFRRVNAAFAIIYYVMVVAMVAIYAARADYYHAVISVGTIFVPPALGLANRLLGFRPSHQLNFLILAFTFLAYPLGGCVDMYRRLPGFDKLAHMLSGVFVSILCIVLYCFLSPGHRITDGDMALAMVFTFFGSMAVAGLWELGEYAISGVVRIDLQRVLATGVADSMNDMIVCMLGTLLTLPAVRSLAKGRSGILTSPIEAFIENNLPA